MNPTETSSAVETVPANDQPLAPFVLTERAVTQVKEIIRSQKFEGFALVIRVVPAGCNGLGYDLNMLKAFA